MKNKNQSLIILAQEYFDCWAKKDLSSLESIFATDVSLKDWNISSEGRDAVLKSNAQIFESVEKLSVKIHSLSQVGDRVIAEITVMVDDNEIPVVDIIEFSSSKISSITAYRGN